MKKVVALIPVMTDSKRLKEKNLLLVNGFPLVYYVVEACKKSGVFSDIYINSENEIFKEIAEELGVKFYHRDPERGGSKCIMKNSSRDCQGTRCQVHDHYILDFIDNIECDKVIQVHSTSPLLKSETIANFTNKVLEEDDNTVFSVIPFKHESFVDGKTVNFDINIKTPTQDLNSVDVISWALSGWDTKLFKKNFETGPTYSGNIKLFPISKIEGIDIDEKQDLFMAEACLAHLKKSENVGKYKYHSNIKGIEDDLEKLIAKDGSPLGVDGDTQIKMTLDIAREKMGMGSWSFPVVLNDIDQVCFIQQHKNEGCRKHYHITKAEFWVIFEGIFEYNLWFNPEDVDKDPDKVIIAKKGDIMRLPKGCVHIIKCISDEPAVRFACGARKMEHIYV
jgi:CMP-N-acetylneuraminic acid synthetase/mannose-6-phosphate isomerase-like protein (cupin superfamily)